MAKSRWTPGFRRTPPGLKKTFGDHLLATATISNLNIKVIAQTENAPPEADSDLEDDTLDEVGGDVSLSIMNHHGKKFYSTLSTMTTEELDELEKVIMLAINIARTVATVRDEVAEEAARNGEDIYYRRHRASPRVSIFERSIAKHAQGIPSRSPNHVGGDGPRDDGSGGSGEDGGGLAEPDASVSSS